MNQKQGVPERERGLADYGDWSAVVRELADHDFDKAKRVLRWPVREALLAYVERLRQQAWQAYRNELQVWAAIAPHSSKPPDAPKPPTF